MQYTSNVTSKGQITIPKELRDKLGLDKSRRTVITLEGDRIIVTKPKSIEEIRALLGEPSGKDDDLTATERERGAELIEKYHVKSPSKKQ